MDKRVQKSKAAIKKSLSELIVKKGFESVKAREVAEKAGVNRSTLYLHYSSLDSILYEMEDDVVNLILTISLKPHNDFRQYIFELAGAIAERKIEIRALLTASYSHLQRKVEIALKPLIINSPYNVSALPPEDQDFIVCFLIDGSIGLINSYFTQDGKPADLDRLVDSFIKFFSISNSLIARK